MQGTAAFGGGAPVTPDPLLQFLQRVVPWVPSHFFNVHAFGGQIRMPFRGGGRAYTDLFAEYGELQNFLWYLNKIDAEVFFCISAQAVYDAARSKPKIKKAIRRLENARWLRALVIDLDVKPGGYASQREALAAVLLMLHRLGLKHGPIVSTGYGLHVYITFDQPIPVDRWSDLSGRLIEAARAKGLKFDVSVTKDGARILRMPGSFNRKDPSNPLEVRILTLGTDMTEGDVAAALASYTPTSGVGVSRSGRPLLIDPAVLPPRPPITYGPEFARVSADLEKIRVVTSMSLLATACPVVANSLLSHGSGDREPLWFELAKLCQYVEDGREWFHKLSDGDPRYDTEQCDQKFDIVHKEGWPSCATVAAAGTEAICKTCAHYGKGLSPIHHATKGLPGIPSASPPVVTPSPTVSQVNFPVNGVNGHTQSHSYLTSGVNVTPIWLDPSKYRYEIPGLIYPLVGTEAYNATPIKDISLEYEQETGDGSYNGFIRFVIERGTADFGNDGNTFTVPLGAATNSTEFARVCGHKGLLFNNQKDAPKIMSDFLTRIREQRMAMTHRRQGWITDHQGAITGFGYGGQVYGPAGPQLSQIGASDPIYSPRGALSDWKVAASTFVGQGCVEMEVVIATAFAAPLVRFTSVDGLLVFVRSSQSGEGKTASLETAASVWMSKQGMLTDSTENALMVRMTKLNNLPLLFDEFIKSTDDRASREFARQILNISAGKQKGRLNRNSKEMPQVATRTMFVGTSNASLVELSRSSDTNAQAARVLELEMSSAIRKLNMTLAQSSVVKEALERNYGCAGAIYADFLGRHHAAIQQIVADTIADIERRVKVGDGGRFWLAAVATIIVGATIARKLGLLNFDIAGIRSYLLGVISTQVSAMQERGTNADDPSVQLQRVIGFLNENVRGRILTDHMPAKGSGRCQVKNPQSTIPNFFVARHADKDNRLWVSESHLMNWCKRQSFSYDHLKEVLIKHNYCSRRRDRRSLGGGCGTDYTTGKEVVLDFDLTNPNVANMLSDT